MLGSPHEPPNKSKFRPLGQVQSHENPKHNKRAERGEEATSSKKRKQKNVEPVIADGVVAVV
jgi:hypothetical protein